MMLLQFDMHLNKSGNSPIAIDILSFNNANNVFLRVEDFCYPVNNGYVDALYSSDGVFGLSNIHTRPIMLYEPAIDYFAIADSIWRLKTDVYVTNVFVEFEDFQVTDEFIKMTVSTKVYARDGESGLALTTKIIQINKIGKKGLMTIFEDSNPKHTYKLPHGEFTHVEAIELNEIVKQSVFGFKEERQYADSRTAGKI